MTDAATHSDEPPRPRIVFADPHRLVAECIGMLLKREFETLEVVTTGRALYEAAMRLQPQIIVSETDLPERSGIDVLRALRERGDTTPFVFVTKHADPDLMEAARRHGASGYVLKSASSHELKLALYGAALESIRQTQARFPKPKRDSLLAQLSPRQRSVARLVADGKTSREIARQLKLSLRSVESHKVALMDLLGTPTTYLLSRRLEELGLRDVPFPPAESE